jgi:hypothetical protein
MNGNSNPVNLFSRLKTLFFPYQKTTKIPSLPHFCDKYGILFFSDYNLNNQIFPLIFSQIAAVRFSECFGFIKADSESE